MLKPSALFRCAVLLGLAITHVAQGVPTTVERRAIPIVPALDPFYDPPAGFESKPPGTILRQRRVVSAIFGLVPNPVTTYQLLYRTTAIDGSAIATVTTIFKPQNATKDRFISFQTAYDSSATICNPSYNYQLGSLQVSLISSVENLLIQAYLISGYIVASSDYEGPDAAFSAGRLSGIGVIDGIRAVANFKSTLGLSTSTPAVVGVGYSGGGIATGWAASLQPTYAPELNIKGWASGGTPANLTGTAEFIDDTVFSGFLIAAVDGLRKPSAYGAQLTPVLNSILTSRGKSLINFASQNCGPADLIAFFHQSIKSYDIQSLGPGVLYQPTIASVLRQQTMGVARNETPTAPVLLYHAVPDEIIPYANASTLRNSWCNYGANVRFTTFAAGGHLTTEILGFVNQFQFAQSAFAGSVASGCPQDTVLDEQLDPLALGVQLEPVLVQLLNRLLDAGPQDSNIKQDIRVLTG